MSVFDKTIPNDKISASTFKWHALLLCLTWSNSLSIKLPKLDFMQSCTAASIACTFLECGVMWTNVAVTSLFATWSFADIIATSYCTESRSSLALRKAYISAKDHIQGLFRAHELNICKRDGFSSLHVPGFTTLHFNPNRNQLVLKSLVIEQLELTTLQRLNPRQQLCLPCFQCCHPLPSLPQILNRIKSP